MRGAKRNPPSAYSFRGVYLVFCPSSSPTALCPMRSITPSPLGCRLCGCLALWLHRLPLPENDKRNTIVSALQKKISCRVRSQKELRAFVNLEGCLVCVYTGYIRHVLDNHSVFCLCASKFWHPHWWYEGEWYCCTNMLLQPQMWFVWVWGDPWFCITVVVLSRVFCKVDEWV